MAILQEIVKVKEENAQSVRKLEKKQLDEEHRAVEFLERCWMARIGYIGRVERAASANARKGGGVAEGEKKIVQTKDSQESFSQPSDASQLD